MDLKRFGSFSEINFREMKELDEFDSVLSSIFTTNFNNFKYPYLDNLSDDPYYFLKMLKRGHVKIYDFEYESYPPQKEDNKYEYFLFNEFRELSRAKSSALMNIYWQAERFFNCIDATVNKLKGVHTFYLCKRDPFPDETEGISFSDYIFYRNQQREDFDENDIMFVRCGSLALNHINDFLDYEEVKYLWVFPFYNFSQNTQTEHCYLIEVVDRSLYALKREKMFDRLSESLSNMFK